jgi:hypothetical protein
LEGLDCHLKEAFADGYIDANERSLMHLSPQRLGQDEVTGILPFSQDDKMRLTGKRKGGHGKDGNRERADFIKLTDAHDEYIVDDERYLMLLSSQRLGQDEVTGILPFGQDEKMRLMDGRKGGHGKGGHGKGGNRKSADLLQ